MGEKEVGSRVTMRNVLEQHNKNERAI